MYFFVRTRGKKETNKSIIVEKENGRKENYGKAACEIDGISRRNFRNFSLVGVIIQSQLNLSRKSQYRAGAGLSEN